VCRRAAHHCRAGHHSSTVVDMLYLVAALIAAVGFCPPDHTAPTRPGPLESDLSAGVTLRWAPSTDDRGPVRYEVYESGRLLTTVTGTEYRYSAFPPPPRIYVFAVRAADPAGNVSASSFTTLGRIWRGDEVPPAPTGVRVEPAGAGLLRVSWTAAAVPPALSAPPVAGYEVLLDGEPAGQVGGTGMVLREPAPGRHTIGVRTLNAVDRWSIPAEVVHVVTAGRR
jgi:hypothetical protein